MVKELKTNRLDWIISRIGTSTSNNIEITTSLSNNTNSSIITEDTISLKPKLSTRPYQEEALAKIEKAYEKGKSRILIALPTGTGKTIVFAHLINRRLIKGRSLVLAHRDELIEQAVEKIKMVIPSASIGVVKAQRNEIDNQIVVASIQTLARKSLLSYLGSFSTIIVDEAHHSAANSYRKVLKALGSFARKDAPLTLGVTATPERGDRVGLHNVFQQIVYHRNLLEMIEEQYLSDLTWQSVNLDIDLDKIGIRSGDFIESQLIKALSDSELPKHTFDAWKKYASDRKTIIFVPGVALAHQTAELFQKHKIRCEAIDGKLPDLDRKAIIARLRNGQTQVVVNCLILTEGFDESSVDCILFARPTKSKPFYLQMLGRGTRLHPGKKDCLIIDIVGVSKKHNLMTLPNLFGLPIERLKQKPLLAVVGEEREKEKARIKFLAEEKQKLLQGLKDKTNQQPTYTYNPKPTYQNVTKEPRQIRFNWLKLNDSCYALSLSKQTIFLLKQSCGHFLAIVQDIDKNKNLLGEHLSLDYAQGVAQDYVRNLNASILVDADASWRKDPATDKQLALLDKFQINHNQDITKGDAANLISAFFVKQDLAYDTKLKQLLEEGKFENKAHL
ncbi:MAG: DEAD/DEAH box helicase [Acidobacteria bacterium]|nr:DEAD/DEAH box helicase [Acidobacteriota bacterium]